MHKSEQKSRLRFIDFILYWEGKIQNKQLVAQFGVSRQQAWQDLQRYAELYPANLQPVVPNYAKHPLTDISFWGNFLVLNSKAFDALSAHIAANGEFLPIHVEG